MEYIWHYKTPIGGITLAANTLAVTGLWFDGQKYYADTLEAEHEEKLIPVIEEAIRWLDIYFAGTVPDFTPPLCMKTTLFRKRVWEIMLTIPYGKTMTYAQKARSGKLKNSWFRLACHSIQRICFVWYPSCFRYGRMLPFARSRFSYT